MRFALLTTSYVAMCGGRGSVGCGKPKAHRIIREAETRAARKTTHRPRLMRFALLTTSYVAMCGGHAAP